MLPDVRASNPPDDPEFSLRTAQGGVDDANGPG